MLIYFIFRLVKTRLNSSSLLNCSKLHQNALRFNLLLRGT
uniref:Uncharacterized protein n=1 Tax=Myoviridae sp. ctLnO19 TaxID=2825085 RepID=A0A8S5P0U4_9CAUD|nr:MAG TPA: hypothetical protein [Myoviridae sp. ctLnO19]